MTQKAIPIKEFIQQAAESAFHEYMSGSDSFLRGYEWPAIIYGVSLDELVKRVRNEMEALLEDHRKKVIEGGG